MTAWNPLLPVELEFENQMKRDMFECRGISGKKKERKMALGRLNRMSRMADITFLIDTHFFFYDLARPGSN